MSNLPRTAFNQIRTMLFLVLLCCRGLPLLADDRLLVKVLVNGKPAVFAFDTGAPTLAIFPKAMERLGLRAISEGRTGGSGDGEAGLGHTEECEFTLGRTNVKTRLHVLEIPPFLDRGRIDGLIGWRPVSKNILRIDAAKLELEPLERVPEEALNWTIIRLRTNADVLNLEIEPEGTNLSIVAVDTGKDNGVSLSPERWQEWVRAHPGAARTVDAAYMPGTGLYIKEEVWAKEIRLGPLVLSDVPVVEANATELGQVPAGFEANLGLAALKRLDFIVDGKQGIAYVRPRTGPALPYNHNRLGAVFVPEDLQHDDLIAHVVKGSPADQAGINNGDLLMKIDKLDVTKWRTDPNVLPLTRFWERPAGTKLGLTLKRGERTLKTTAVLRDILGPEKRN